MQSVYSFIEKGDLVFDVGANIGGKSDLYLSHGAGKVVCVEPIPHCVNKLKEKYKDNDKVIIIPKGLADKEGELTLSICSSDDVLSTFTEHWKKGRFASYKWDKKMQIKVITLDSLVEEFGEPAFCKIDVEGFESKVIAGLTSKKIKSLSFEFAVEFIETNIKDSIIHLSKIGYDKFNIGIAADEHLYLKNWVTGDRMMGIIRNLIKTHPHHYQLWGDIYVM